MEQYQYRECGLDFVYLMNGFHRVNDADGNEVIVIEDVEQLHKVIRGLIVEIPRPLDPKEFRFLRKEIELSQRALASTLGVDEQTVSSWERGITAIPQSAELILRAWVKECDSERPAIRELTERLNAVDHEIYKLEKAMELSLSGSTWVKRAA